MGAPGWLSFAPKRKQGKAAKDRGGGGDDGEADKNEQHGFFPLVLDNSGGQKSSGGSDHVISRRDGTQ